MQIHAIHIDHLLSFNTFTWKELNPHLNVIVGPNGVGKTNLFHALRAVRDALNQERNPSIAAWADAGHQGTDTSTFTIELDIRFTTAWEQRLLSTFMAMVLCDQQAIQQTLTTSTQRNLNPDSLRRFATWVQEHLHPENFSWLFSGRLVVTYAGREGWQCRYDLGVINPFELNLTNGGTLLGRAKHIPQNTAQNRGSLFAAWRNSLTEQERGILDELLTGGLAEYEAPFPIPDFSHLPDWISSQQGVPLRIDDQMRIVDPVTLSTYRTFSSLAQLSLEPGNFLAARSVFQRLFNQALVFTDNMRLLPKRIFAAEELLMPQIDLSNGEQLANFLFCKKNGDSQDRKQYIAIQQLFSQMTKRQFDVVLGQTNIGRASQEQSSALLELVISSLWGDIPLGFSGAGIGEALFLSAVLAGTSGQVVLLDEPALNLHPTMQTILLGEMLALAHQTEGEGSQFLVNTHTPTLVPPDAIDCVSRFTLQDGQHTIRRAVDTKKITSHALDDLRKLLRGNLTARALLFSRAVLLVEGETELGALPVWCPDLMRQDIAMYVVGGKGNFVSLLKLIHHLAIPWAIIGDGEVLWDQTQQRSSHGPQGHISSILAVGSQSLPPIPGTPGSNAQDFAQWQQDLESSGIFTLANNANDGFERAIQAEIPSQLWTDANVQFGSNKVTRARFIAENCPRPQKVSELILKVTHHLREQGADISVSDGG